MTTPVEGPDAEAPAVVPRGRVRHVGAIVGDLPNALRFRTRALSSWPVPPAFAEGSRRPVVLIPGVYERWHYLRPVADALHAAGHPVHAILRLGLNSRPVPWSAGVVSARIRDLDLRDAAIVAHSKGGLIGKHVMAFGDPERRVDRMIAVATPFGGSALADRMPAPSLRIFSPSHPVIRRLEAASHVNERITSIAPRWDPHIPGGSQLAGARNITLDVMGHFRVLTDPRLPALVVDEVARTR
ncbi:triacylglycerol lipase [Salinibacterium sp. ZJ70]|uniref:esterase/lipase family protein n=1 Tax=Salinibacterium sp. ZJ70 TaxID=2708084 RepID=UPI00141E202D|nr:alpha/beta hydrolase [Salinibacterium sp. ZJ70]